MRIKLLSRFSLIIELENSPSGYKFLLEEQEGARGESQIKVTSPNGERIMYGTEQGNNNADYVFLIKGN